MNTKTVEAHIDTSAVKRRMVIALRVADVVGSILLPGWLSRRAASLLYTCVSRAPVKVVHVIMSEADRAAVEDARGGRPLATIAPP